eukprot:CAMPEP_0172894782 /NCGR_PEP_ID=MMETSP1075-20121228/151651_1 /TAXON_ID=2916 /ORGANISM="Ceratium fusus, Strain PA161109" /LENGTH=50 /DNA_ID=CAMNT_0013749861 /DNA_START=172 /DNA_END=321 /DNA_ORIENTATION=-
MHIAVGNWQFWICHCRMQRAAWDKRLLWNEEDPTCPKTDTAFSKPAASKG